jgi:hypothetical protein
MRLLRVPQIQVFMAVLESAVHVLQEAIEFSLTAGAGVTAE